MLLRFLLISCALASTFSATAAPDDDAMVDRYHGLERCMDRALGKGWQARYEVPMALNRWGAMEPSAREVDRAPQAVRLVALRCERESGIDGASGR